MRNYLTNVELIEEIKLSKGKHRDAPHRTVSECLTPRFASCLMVLVNRYASKRNWASYTYIDDMKSEALLNLCQNAFKFDESRFNNAFAYYTTIVTNTFISFIEKEKRQRDIKDDLIEAAHMMPSFERQLRNEK